MQGVTLLQLMYKIRNRRSAAFPNIPSPKISWWKNVNLMWKNINQNLPPSPTLSITIPKEIVFLAGDRLLFRTISDRLLSRVFNDRFFFGVFFWVLSDWVLSKVLIDKVLVRLFCRVLFWVFFRASVMGFSIGSSLASSVIGSSVLFFRYVE